MLENVYSPEAHSKVTIHKVSIENKPKETTIAKLSYKNILKKLIKVANELDKRNLAREADKLDKIIKEMT